MRSRPCFRVARPLRTSHGRLPHEQETLEHGGDRKRNPGYRVAENDRPLVRARRDQFAEVEARAQQRWIPSPLRAVGSRELEAKTMLIKAAKPRKNSNALRRMEPAGAERHRRVSPRG